MAGGRGGRKGWPEGVATRKGWQPIVEGTAGNSDEIGEYSVDVSSNREKLVFAGFSRPWTTISARFGGSGPAEKANHCVLPSGVGIEEHPSYGARLTLAGGWSRPEVASMGDATEKPELL